MSRKKDEVGVSFFAFQDIITAVTGIMFLVVLLIILLIFEKRSIETVEQVDAKELEKVQAQIEAIQKIIVKHETPVVEFDEKVTPEELKEQLETLDQTIESLTIQNEKVTEKLKILNEDERICKETIANTNLQLEKTKIELEQRQKELEKKKKRISLSIDGTTNKKPIFVECNATEIRLQESPGAKTQTFPNRDAFLTWTKTISPQNIYFILLLKPEAYVYGNKLQNELKKLGFERGVETLPESNSEVF